MKICYYCDHENFENKDVCERCGKSIFEVKPDIFNIAGFLKRNYQLYATFGILVALFTYLFTSDNSYAKFAGFVPFLVAIYLMIHLMQKSKKIITSRTWNQEEEYLHFESIFHGYIFLMIHLIFIVALIFYIPENLRIFVALFGGLLLFLLYFSSNFSNIQIRRTLWILVASALLIEVALFLALFIPIMSNLTNDPNIAFFYSWSIPLIILFSFGGIIAYFIIMVAFSLHKQNIVLTSVLIDDFTKGKYGLIISLGVVLGITVSVFLRTWNLL